MPYKNHEVQVQFMRNYRLAQKEKLDSLMSIFEDLVIGKIGREEAVERYLQFKKVQEEDRGKGKCKI